MINAIREYYKTYLKSRVGEFIKLDELELDLTFATITNWPLIIAHGLSLSKAGAIHYGIKVSGSGATDIQHELVTVTTHNELKSQGAVLGLTKDNTEDDDAFNKAANDAVNSHKEEVEKTTQKVPIKVHDSRVIMLPFDVNLKDYQIVIDKINALGFTIYDEELYLEIL